MDLRNDVCKIIEAWKKGLTANGLSVESGIDRDFADAVMYALNLQGNEHQQELREKDKEIAALNDRINKLYKDFFEKSIYGFVEGYPRVFDVTSAAI